jgi:hypothetical protein
LIKLLLASPYKKLSYNEFRLQKELPSINTCGRHCCVRLLLKDLSLQQYVSYLSDRYPNQSADQIVLMITNNFFRS